jgi:Xaa-Pro aminopeptidase
MDEIASKLGQVRGILAEEGLAGVRLRALDWTAWVTGGGAFGVLLAAETGVADVLVTAGGAWVLTDAIEAERLAAEEVPPGFEVWASPWTDRAAQDRFARARCGDGRIASDRPRGGEEPLPEALEQARATLLPVEVERYRALGRDAAAAVTDVLAAAQPGWTGFALAGAAAEALWSRGIDPALALVAGEKRLPRYRHPTPSRDPLGGRAMLVVCARRHGLYACFTRFVAFRPLTAAERRLDAAVARVEAAALEASRPGVTLGELYDTLVAAYAREGHAGEEAKHHQGGPCGYLPRDALALPGSRLTLAHHGAVAWNPSLPGAKIEDTVLVGDGDAEVLTADPRWPAEPVAGRARPVVLER